MISDITCISYHVCTDWGPHASLTAPFPACRSCVSFSKDMLFLERCVLVFVNIKSVYQFATISNRRGTQIRAEKLSNFVLNFHLDLIGDQNDVQYL